MRSYLVALLSCSLLAALATGDFCNGHKVLNAKGGTIATFSNLDKLTASNAWIPGKDTVDLANAAYSYWLSPCAASEQRPPSNEAPGCASGEQDAMVYQSWTEANGDHCKALGKTTADGFPKFYASASQDIGVSLKFTGGDTCNTNNVDRNIQVNFICAPKDDTIAADVTMDISENSHCSYTSTVSSLFACPDECFAVDNYVCSGHGICQFDSDANVARCFCNSGRGGSDCTKKVSTSSNKKSSSAANTTLIVFIILLLVALIGVSAVLYTKIKTLRADDSSYGQLSEPAAL